MKHNDISNSVRDNIAFRVDGCLLEKTKTFPLRLFDSYDYSFFNKEVKEFLYFIYFKTAYTIDLVINYKYSTNRLKILDKVPCNYLYAAVDESIISNYLRLGTIKYYIDTNEERRRIINNNFALSLDTAKTLFRR